jgi:hypothetical protein
MSLEKAKQKPTSITVTVFHPVPSICPQCQMREREREKKKVPRYTKGWRWKNSSLDGATLPAKKLPPAPLPKVP